MKLFNVFAITLFVGSAGFITYSLIKDSGKKYYAATQPKLATIEEKLHLSGFVYPNKEIEIKPQISGVVDAVLVNIGDTVKIGDPVASVSLVPNSSEVEQLSNSVRVAKINLSTAKTNYDRQKSLLEKKAIPQTEFEVAEKEYLTAKENYSSSIAQLSLRQKSNNSSHNLVRSSTAGVVIDVPVKVGTSVVERGNFNSGSTIATIAGAEHYIFKANVPERNIRSINIGMPVRLTLLAYEDIEIEAVIVKISAKGEMLNGAVKFPVEAEFTLINDQINLRSGYSATAEILLSRAENVLSLPENCVNFKGDTAFVYITDSLKNIAKEKIISLGLSDGEIVQIEDGLTENDIVVTNYHD